MQEVSQGQGRTVLFVSHNMDSIRKLCPKSIILKTGQLIYYGDTSNAIKKYLSNKGKNLSKKTYMNKRKDELELTEIEVVNYNITNKDVKIIVSYTLHETLKNLRVTISLFHDEGVLIFSTSDFHDYSSERIREAGSYKSICTLPAYFLNAGNYKVGISIDIPRIKAFIVDEVFDLSIEELDKNFLGISLKGIPDGLIHPKLQWEILKQKI